MLDSYFEISYTFPSPREDYGGSNPRWTSLSSSIHVRFRPLSRIGGLTEKANSFFEELEFPFPLEDWGGSNQNKHTKHTKLVCFRPLARFRGALTEQIKDNRDSIRVSPSPLKDMEGSNKMEMKDRGILNVVSVPSRGFGGF